jgi:MFS family permease
LDALTTSRKILNPAAIALLLFANIVTSINQYNIASVFFLISSSFNQGVTGLGFLTSSFYLAYGVFEVPGGIIAAKFGPKKITVVGTIIYAGAVIASSVSPSFLALGALRFLEGLGFSFAFPSILVLIVRYYKQGSEGFGVGLMTFSSFLGGAIGLFGWSILGVITGWRPSLLIGGILCLVAGVGMIFILPPDTKSPDFRIKISDLKRIISNRLLVVLSIAVFGIAATVGLTSSFLIFYLEAHFKTNPGYAGLIGGLSAIFPIFSGPTIGRVYDRLHKPKLLIVVSAIAVTIGVSITAIDSIYAAILSSTIIGLSSGTAFTVILSLARESSSSNPQFESLAVAWVDSFSLYGNFVSPIYFSILVVEYSYSSAWLLGGLVAILLTIPVIFLKSERFSLNRKNEISSTTTTSPNESGSSVA